MQLTAEDEEFRARIDQLIATAQRTAPAADPLLREKLVRAQAERALGLPRQARA